AGRPLRGGAGFRGGQGLAALCGGAGARAGAAALQPLAVRAARDAARLSDGTRLARSLAERMRVNPRALAQSDNPYLHLDYDASGGAPTAPAPCYADADCDADELARFDVFEVAEAVAAGFPGGRLRVCRDAGSPDAAGVLPWTCEEEDGAPVVVKLGWRAQGDRETGAPKLMMPLAGAAP
ncbi:hypothetical protein ACCD01_31330, partial [Telluria sp. Tellsp99]